AASALATLPCRPTAPVCAAAFTAWRQARSICSASVRQYPLSCLGPSTSSALTLRPRAARKAIGVARLSPESMDSMSQEHGVYGVSSRILLQTAWVARVTMFWPAASPVEYSNSVYTVLPTTDD